MRAYFVAVLLFWTYLDSTPGGGVYAEPIVSVNTPINPVETGAVFAVHCQVWNLDDGQSVQVFKITKGRSIQLSIDNAVVPGAEERVFLASRHMPDGSVVYFLSIIDATLADEAEYSCKVISTYPSLTEVAVNSVNVEVMYFPADSDLVCDPLQTATFYEGDYIRLGCNSEEGNPAVSLSWVRTTETNREIKSVKSSRNGRLYSVADIQARVKDNGAMFVCEVSNSAFPGLINTCHVGPVVILPNPRGPVFKEEPSTTEESILTNIVKTGGNFEIPLTEDQCRDVCDLTADSTLMYWVIGTIVAAVLALIFCVVFMFLLLKLCRASEEFTEQAYSPPIEDPEKIYVEVDSKRDSGKMYMSLVKPYPDSHMLQHVPQKM